MADERRACAGLFEELRLEGQDDREPIGVARQLPDAKPTTS